MCSLSERRKLETSLLNERLVIPPPSVENVHRNCLITSLITRRPIRGNNDPPNGASKGRHHVYARPAFLTCGIADREGEY